MQRSPRPEQALNALRWPLALTRAGMVAERLLIALWPVLALAFLFLGAVMLGLPEVLPVELVWGGGVIALLGGLYALLRGLRSFRWPGRAEARARLDQTLPGRPLQSLSDAQAVGAQDPASRAVWQAHQQRMAERTRGARAVRPDLRLSQRDPYALRYAALLALVVGLLFGSVWRVTHMGELAARGGDPAAIAVWEGWAEPPRYTGLPALYLNDQPEGALRLPEGSRILLRFYGEPGALTLAETVSGRVGDIPSAADPQQDFDIARSGELRVDGPGGRVWEVDMITDAPPQVEVSGPAGRDDADALTLPFQAQDDYGITTGEARITLDLDALERRHGLAPPPEPRPEITVPLPLPVTGNRREIEEIFTEVFTTHPWADLPVRLTLSVTDAADQTGQSEPLDLVLPGRGFFDPMAAAIIEQRRDLLWTRANAPRVAQILRAISHRPDGAFRRETDFLRLRVILRRLETMTGYGLSVEQQDEIAQAMWDLAVRIEDGDIGDALERMRRAQERLSEAMKNGADEEQLAELMEELRRATDEYLRQMQRQAQQDSSEGAQQPLSEDAMRMSQDDLAKMMERIQELIEQGRMAEAQQALEEFQQLMENMRVTQGQGQSGPSEGQRAMEEMGEALREQQGLSDQAFRDLQEQYNPGNPGAQAGQSDGNEGRDGGRGRGRDHQGQSGQGQGGGARPGQQGGQGQGEGSLADRQNALRQEIERQKRALPGLGGENGQATRDALDRAGRAMGQAEQSLRQDDYAGAIDQQSDAMDALREGMQALGEAMAERQQGEDGQGQAPGDNRSSSTDPLGRELGSAGGPGVDEHMLQGEDVYRRARRLLDEVRRRSGEGARPQLERDYLRRLLDRF